MPKKRICRHCNAWDVEGTEMNLEVAGTIVPAHHCKRRCPQIVWVLQKEDIGTTFPATCANDWCMEFELRDKK